MATALVLASNVTGVVRSSHHQIVFCVCVVIGLVAVGS